MIARFLVRLLGANPDEFFKDVPHLNVVDVSRRKINSCECLDDFVQLILFIHLGNLHAEIEPIENVAHVPGKAVDVTVEIRTDFVRRVEKSRHIELRQVVEGELGRILKKLLHNHRRFRFYIPVRLKDLRFGRREEAIKASQNRERENHFTIFIPLVRTAQEIANAPDEVGKLTVGLGGHRVVNLRAGDRRS